MSKRQPRTFSEFFVSQNKKISATQNFPDFVRSSTPFIETPRELPGLDEMLEEEALRRRFKSFIRSHRGGSRTVAPAPEPIGKVGNYQVFHQPSANAELKPRVHVAKPVPTALEREAKVHARDKAKALALARTHAKALREAADAAEARLATMEG